MGNQLLLGRDKRGHKKRVSGQEGSTIITKLKKKKPNKTKIITNYKEALKCT